MTKWILMTCLVAMLAFGLCHAGDQPKERFAELEGTWVIVNMEIEGKSLLEKGERWKVIIKDGKARLQQLSSHSGLIAFGK
jgi:hypothetical protein